MLPAFAGCLWGLCRMRAEIPGRSASPAKSLEDPAPGHFILLKDAPGVDLTTSGFFVRERTGRPVGLRPHLEAAFTELPDEAALRERARTIAHSVEVLAELGLVQSASVQVKVHRASSLFKLVRPEPFLGSIRCVSGP
ncbi:hypothetical protein [Streptosporangium saharense]|uniref:Uncharacterized protein n=1 Tax=Streptosporangium saharense TaxID=1706840 RepID=A0A7W7QRT8_9ACTN|nr:hypothetical protein [Streptosporangium saharense]MBB4918413.1 hypothetical protein [Streptosporangium saharense]